LRDWGKAGEAGSDGHGAQTNERADFAQAAFQEAIRRSLARDSMKPKTVNEI